jgi:hypothetical protein
MWRNKILPDPAVRWVVRLLTETADMILPDLFLKRMCRRLSKYFSHTFPSIEKLELCQHFCAPVFTNTPLCAVYELLITSAITFISKNKDNYHNSGHYLSCLLFKRDVLETEFCPYLQEEPTQLGSINRASFFLRRQIGSTCWAQLNGFHLKTLNPVPETLF